MEVAQSAQFIQRWLYRQGPLCLLVILGAFYYTTLAQLLARWTRWDESMAHGLPIVLVFAALLYQRAHEFVPQPMSWLGKSLAWSGLLLLSLLWALFHLANINILEQLVLVPLLVAGLWVVYGWPVVWRHRLLLALPLFAIPVWDYLNTPLLYLSSEVVGQMVRWAQMPAIIEGNSIFIPYGHILIADGCSGLRYFVVALALGYLIGLLNRYGESRMLVLVVVAALLGLITNWVRIFVLIVIGYKTEMQSSLMADHEMFGWALFAIIALPAIYFAPVVKSKVDTPGTKLPNPHQDFGGAKGARIVGLLLVIALGPALSVLASGTMSQSEANPRLDILEAQPSEAMPMPLRLPQADLTERVKIPRTRVYAQLDHYLRQNSAEELVPYLSSRYDTSVWRELDSDTRAWGGKPVHWARYKSKTNNRYVLQSQWFTLGSRVTSSVEAAKLWQILAVLQGVHDFTVNTLQAECAGQACESARQKLEQYTEQLLQQQLQQKPKQQKDPL